MSIDQLIEGRWFDGQSSHAHCAHLQIDAQGQVRLLSLQSDLPPLFSGHISQLTVSARLADTPRYLSVPGGGQFETLQNDAVDQCLRQHAPGRWDRWPHLLESKYRFFLSALLVLVLVVYWGAVSGLPWLSLQIATHLPIAVEQKIGKQTLAALDQQWFEPSALDVAVQRRVSEHLSVVSSHLPEPVDIIFRAGDLGANAFALPGGIVVFTDDMVLMAEHDDELLAVMAHEVGHLVHRHGLRSVIQSSLISGILVLLSGDGAAVSDLFLALPVMLTRLGYSRHFEREADTYALEYLQAEGIETAHFSRLMQRVIGQHCDKEQRLVEDALCQWQKQPWAQYLSTHPLLDERIERFGH